MRPSPMSIQAGHSPKTDSHKTLVVKIRLKDPSMLDYKLSKLLD
jgi:hypothetical protein